MVVVIPGGGAWHGQMILLLEERPICDEVLWLLETIICCDPFISHDAQVLISIKTLSAPMADPFCFIGARLRLFPFLKEISFI